MNPKHKQLLNRQRPLSKYPPMSLHDRAAQFAPFAALTGHDECLMETSRITQEKRELFDDKQKEIKLFLDELIHMLSKKNKKDKSYPLIYLTYFIPDEKKDGGLYQSTQIAIKKFSEEEQSLITTDGLKIKIENILDGFFLND